MSREIINHSQTVSSIYKTSISKNTWKFYAMSKTKQIQFIFKFSATGEINSLKKKTLDFPSVKSSPVSTSFISAWTSSLSVLTSIRSCAFSTLCSCAAWSLLLLSLPLPTSTHRMFPSMLLLLLSRSSFSPVSSLFVSFLQSPVTKAKVVLSSLFWRLFVLL